MPFPLDDPKPLAEWAEREIEAEREVYGRTGSINAMWANGHFERKERMDALVLALNSKPKEPSDGT